MVQFVWLLEVTMAFAVITAQILPTNKVGYLDCSECYGHGVNPRINPLCKHGCGRYVPISHVGSKTRFFTGVRITRATSTSTKTTSNFNRMSKEDYDFYEMIKRNTKNGLTFFAGVTVGCTLFTVTLILTCLYKRKERRVTPLITNIGETVP